MEVYGPICNLCRVSFPYHCTTFSKIHQVSVEEALSTMPILIPTCSFFVQE